MFRFTIRDLLWLLVVGALSVALILQHRQTHLARVAWREEQARTELIAKLDQTTNIYVNNISLKDVALFVQAQRDVPILLAERTDGQKPGTVAIQNASLRTALERLLPPLGLDYRIKEGRILIEPKRERQS